MHVESQLGLTGIAVAAVYATLLQSGVEEGNGLAFVCKGLGINTVALARCLEELTDTER